jgi:hypothetical protein
MLTVALVVMVIFMFLRNLWATVIPSISVPLSLVGTFGVMYLLGYSIDNLSLMALAIVTGFVVDDAIVVIETSQPLSGGGRLAHASGPQGFQGNRTDRSVDERFADLRVYSHPLMGGIVGRLFREFAVTLSVAIAFPLCFAHRHAHDVRALPEIAEGYEAWANVHGQGSGLPKAASFL